MAKPKLALIPAAQGSKLFSVLPSSGVGDFDFTRSGSATRINSQGLIEEVANGQSRLNYPMIDGKVVGCPHHILEGDKTNLIAYSEDFTGALINCTVLRNQILSPDGALNADKLSDNSSNGEHLINGNILGSIVSGTDYTASVFFKSNNLNAKAVIRLWSGSSYIHSVFDLDTQQVSYNSIGTAGIEKYPNEWYRCSFSFTASGNFTNSNFQVGIANNLNQFSYQGASNLDIYFWGAQLEQGSYPTSYIKTNGEANGVTRSAETANGSGDAATFNDSEGVLMAEIKADQDIATSERITISNGNSSNDRVVIEYDETFGLVKFWVTGGGTTNGEVQISGIKKTQFNKISVLYKANLLKIYINGFNVGNGTGIVAPTGLDNLKFEQAVGGNNFYGNTKQIQYYNSALTDSELEQLTSWTSFTDMAQGQLYTIE